MEKYSNRTVEISMNGDQYRITFGVERASKSGSLITHENHELIIPASTEAEATAKLAAESLYNAFRGNLITISPETTTNNVGELEKLCQRISERYVDICLDPSQPKS